MAEAAQSHARHLSAPSRIGLVTVLGANMLGQDLQRELKVAGTEMSKVETVSIESKSSRTPVFSLFLKVDDSLIGGVADFEPTKMAESEDICLQLTSVREIDTSILRRDIGDQGSRETASTVE